MVVKINVSVKINFIKNAIIWCHRCKITRQLGFPWREQEDKIPSLNDLLTIRKSKNQLRVRARGMLLGWKAFLLRKMTHFCFSAKHTAGDRLWFGKQQNILDLFLKVRWSGNIKLMQ